MAEEHLQEPAIHLPVTTNFPTLHALLNEPPRELPVINPEAPPAEPEVPPTPTSKTLFKAPIRKPLYTDYKMIPMDPTAETAKRNLPGRTHAPPSHSAQQPASARGCNNSALASLVQTPIILQMMNNP